MLTTPEQRAAFLSENYWNNFDFADTSLITKPEITEQAFVDFIDILQETTLPKAETGIKNMLDKSLGGDSLMFEHFVELCEKYLYDPNSPFRREDYFIPVLRYIIDSDSIGELEKIRPQYLLTMALKNRPGEVATNFSFTTDKGKEMSLSDIKAQYTILFFNNPDCADCKRVKALLWEWQDERVKVVAIYPDEDLQMWRAAEYPAAWINGNNHTINKDKSYDLRAIPTLYLLDRDKKVILKDAPVEAILHFFEEQ
ncbi:hypothetical protein BN938_1499 [Mucinivorans hirudinis]|uniref:Thioredoxin domain-containing protein n=1 Tax=Mucinivorans hirudinis TaxID=1433126 RepID=A0A060R840_9BACT|nr:hypothetical protein BN938_1499 [Mucinivorans hirudinis]